MADRAEQGLSCWLWMETGSNQSYIFQTTKQRLQLAASAKTREIGEAWIPRALAEEERARGLASGQGFCQVAKASGLAITRVVDTAFGRAVIERVTRQVLDSGSGIDLWGVVRSQQDGETLAQALNRTGELFQEARYGRQPPSLRARNTPFTAPCVQSGRAGAYLARDGGGLQVVSGQIRSLWDPQAQARTDLVAQLRSHCASAGQDALIEGSVVSLDRLRQGNDLDHQGWYGVLHADGNGIGSVFTHLAQAFDDDERFLQAETALSDELHNLTWKAMAATIVEVADRAAGGQAPPTNWVLPFLVGGDDMSVVLSGTYAFEFARVLAQKFEEYVVETDFPAIVEKLARRTDLAGVVPQKLSLGTGLVFVKPHHPFTHAIKVAEELAGNAKQLTRDQAAIDVQVIYEPGVRTAAAIRADSEVIFQPYYGPFTWAGEGPGSYPYLEEIMQVVSLPALSGAALHDLRSALIRQAPTAEFDAGVDTILTVIKRGLDRLEDMRADQGKLDRIRQSLRQDLVVEPDLTGFASAKVTHSPALLTAVEICDVTYGTAFGRAKL